VCKDNTKLTVGVFYRSPCSTAENDLNLFALISSLCTAKVGNLLCLGDFNWPNIDWSTWTPSSKSGSEFQFINTLRKNFLNQYVSKPNRARGDDHPHILDLVLTNESFIENLAMLAPLGKNDHSVLSIDCTLQTDVVQKVVKHNYNKDYEGMRQIIKINWKELLLPLHNDIDTMLLTFKQELQHRTLQFIPTMRNTWKEEGWMHPLNTKLREYISKNINFGLDIWRSVIMLYLKNINQSEIELKMKFVNYKKRNNKMSLSIANKIQRPSGSIVIANVKLKLALVIYIL